MASNVCEYLHSEVMLVNDRCFLSLPVHGASGYLVSQFLDNTANKRTDEWGGSKQNRARFGLEVLSALSDVFGPERVGVKISPTGGYNEVLLEDCVYGENWAECYQGE